MKNQQKRDTIMATTNNLTNIAIAVLLLCAALLACADCDNFGAFLLVKGIALGLGYAGVKLYKFTRQ